MESILIKSFPLFTYFLFVLLVLLVLLVAVDSLRVRKDQSEAPGPLSLPLIGSLHLLAGYKVPFEGFTALGRKYGQVFKIDMGSVPCVVVNGLDNIREVLMAKGAHFDGRPNFQRYHQIFSGNKENSLAFCDWSEVQRARREMLRAHTFPRSFSERFHSLDGLLAAELSSLVDHLHSDNHNVALKPLILHACANVFTNYFATRHFERNDLNFSKMIKNFDNIFFEVNQGYAADFMPWLLPLHGSHFTEVSSWSHAIRGFMDAEIVGKRVSAWRPDQPQEDYVDALLEHVNAEMEPRLSWDSAMFALEDIIGGHTAVGNLLMKILAFVATRPEVQRRIQAEADMQTEGGHRHVCLSDRPSMAYTEAVILEAVRLIASPIVPHVANQDSSIAGFHVKKNTLIFLNNHELNMSESLWNEPALFLPERFLVDGRIVKPEHFLPFGVGRRSCMGYKMVQLLAFNTLASLLLNFNILPVDGVSYEVPVGDLALPWDTYTFSFQKRA